MNCRIIIIIIIFIINHGHYDALLTGYIMIVFTTEHGKFIHVLMYTASADIMNDILNRGKTHMTTMDVADQSHSKLTSMTKYLPGSLAIFANSLASSLNVGRQSASIVQPVKNITPAATAAIHHVIIAVYND